MQRQLVQMLGELTYLRTDLETVKSDLSIVKGQTFNLEDNFKKLKIGMDLRFDFVDDQLQKILWGAEIRPKIAKLEE